MRIYMHSSCILVVLLGRMAYCREAPSGSYYYPPSPSKEGFTTSQPWNDQPSSPLHFYVLAPEGAKGPYSIQELSGLVEKGIIKPETQVQREDGEELRTLGGLLERYRLRSAYEAKGSEDISEDDFGGVKDAEGGRFVESVAAVRSGLGSFFGLKDKKQNLMQHLPPQYQNSAMPPIYRQGSKKLDHHQSHKAEWHNNVPHHHLPQQQYHPSKSCYSRGSAKESPTGHAWPSPHIRSAVNGPGQQQHEPFSRQQQIYQELYPPPSTSPHQCSTVAAQEERDMGENVGFPEAELNCCRGIPIDQNECFERRNKPGYGREGGYKQDDVTVDTSGDTNKPSVGGYEQLCSVPGESFNSVRGTRMADSNEVSSSRIFSVFRVLSMHWRIIRLTCQGGGFGGVMACFVLAIAKACITLSIMINGIGMFEMIPTLQHNGNDLFQRGTEYAALLTALYMATLAVDGISQAVLFRVGRRSVLENSQILLLSSESDLGRDAFSHSLLAPWQYTRNVLHFTEAGMTLLGSIVLLNLMLKGSWIACATVVGLGLKLVKMAILPSDSPMAMLLRIIDLDDNNSNKISTDDHRSRNVVSLFLNLFLGVLSWGMLSITLGCLYFAIEELFSGLAERELALFLIGFVFIAQQSLRSSTQALNGMQGTFPVARRVILRLHERRVSRQGFIKPSADSRN